MWMIFWGLLLFVFFDFRINGIVFTPDFVGFFLVWLGIIRCRGIQTFARYYWTALVACVFSGGQYVFTGFTEYTSYLGELELSFTLVRTVLQAVVTYVIVKGMVELETNTGQNLKSRGLFYAWLLMEVVSACGTVLTYLLDSLLVSIITIIVSVIGVVWYLVKFYQCLKMISRDGISLQPRSSKE